MSIRGIDGQDVTLRSALYAAPSPSRQPRAADAGRDTAPTARGGPGPSEESVRQPAPNTEAKTPDLVKAPPQRTGTRLRIDEASKRIVAQIVDENNEVIKQIPPEEILKIAARFREISGKMFDRKV